MLQGGDDLDDDFVVDDLVALSDDDLNIIEDSAYFSDTTEEPKIFQDEREETQPSASVVDPAAKKRKRREKEKEKKAKVRPFLHSIIITVHELCRNGN